MKCPSPLELTASHDAGHAVVATVLRRKIRQVAIRSVRGAAPSWLGKEEQGRVRLAWEPVSSRPLHHVRDHTQTVNPGYEDISVPKQEELFQVAAVWERFE